LPPTSARHLNRSALQKPISPIIDIGVIVDQWSRRLDERLQRGKGKRDAAVLEDVFERVKEIGSGHGVVLQLREEALAPVATKSVLDSHSFRRYALR
jgi:hypothetical protein